MKEQLVGFDVAILAKEEGFDWKVRDYFHNNINVNPVDYPINFNFKNYSTNKEILISAPTQSLLQKWLREVHGIDITIHRSFSFTQSYHYCIIKDCDYENELRQVSESNRSYEVCLENALLEGLKMIKKKI